MVSALISRVMVLGVGTLYPAYRSYKAVRTKDVREYVKWMMYWIVFALYLCLETFLDIFVAFWLPFYYELKIVFVVWLLSPYTKGASVLYRKFIHPTLNRHEEEIDLALDQAKNSSYSTLLKLGSQGVLYAREVVATAAVAGHQGLLNQAKKSFSMSDLSAADDERRGPQIEEIIEEEEEGGAARFVGYYEDGRVVEERVDGDDDGFEDLQPQNRREGLRPRKGNPDYSETESATLPRRSTASSGAAGRSSRR